MALAQHPPAPVVGTQSSQLQFTSGAYISTLGRKLLFNADVPTGHMLEDSAPGNVS